MTYAVASANSSLPLEQCLCQLPIVDRHRQVSYYDTYRGSPPPGRGTAGGLTIFSVGVDGPRSHPRWRERPGTQGPPGAGAPANAANRPPRGSGSDCRVISPTGSSDEAGPVCHHRPSYAQPPRPRMSEGPATCPTVSIPSVFGCWSGSKTLRLGLATGSSPGPMPTP